MGKLSKEDKEILVRETLGRIADKWTLVVIEELGDEPIRFSALQKKVGKISQKMLTQTLREMERDGLVERKVYPEVPPRVEYRLTKLGYSLGETVCSIWNWVEKNYSEIEKNRLKKRAFNG
ncbi:MAG: winged helix-turn-helix transcriptional regulator [Pseudobdellovibrionaceae bacterium]